MLRERLDDELLRDVLAAALRTGAEYADLFAEHRRGRSLRLEDGRVVELTSSVDAGAGVRVVNGRRAAYAYTNVLTRRSLLRAARVAAAGARGDTTRTVADLTRHDRRVEHPVRVDPLAAAKEQLVELARRADESARAVSGDVRQVVVTYLDSVQDVLVATSEGRRADDERTRTRLAATVVAARDGELRTGFEGPGASAGHELFDSNPPEEIGRLAAARAVAMLGARPAPTGELPVVLWRGDAGVFVHEACGHGMEGDTVAKRASVFANRRGERLGSDLLTCVDDATVMNAWGSFSFDDEGTIAQRTTLLDHGVVTSYLTDRRSARQLAVPSTGNGRRQSYAHVPIVRMTNTHVLPGDATPDAVIASLERGILCKGLGGGQVDAATGDFVFGLAEAYLVESGEIGHAVRGANLVGNGPETLQRIDAICADFAVKQGICGKDGQGVPVGNGSPTVLIGRMTVGGTG